MAARNSEKGKLMFVQSVDGRQQKSKHELMSERTKHKKDTVFNKLGHVLDLDLLRKCYHKLEWKKRWV